MDRDLFLQDVLRKPEVLSRLEGHNFKWPDLRGKRIFFVGMGSSHFAAKTIAHRLQVQGINAYAMLASVQNLPILDKDDAVVAISASGNSVETNDFISRVSAPVILLTNNAELNLDHISEVIYINATTERGGVACLSYMATLIALLQLEEQLTSNKFLDDAISKSVHAVQHILDTQDLWTSLLDAFVSGDDGVQFAAQLERLSSAEQSALMIRECARKKADASEIGDWSHVDVYLTKTTDYRLIAFSGSRWTEQMLEWTTKRNSRVLQIGHQTPNAELDFPYSDDALVALLSEVTYAEITSGSLWYHTSK